LRETLPGLCIDYSRVKPTVIDVQFSRAGSRYMIAFAYDPDIVAAIKDVPSPHRRYNPQTRIWTVGDEYAGGLAAELADLGFTVAGIDGTVSRRRDDHDDAAWARALFERIARDRPDLIDAVFRAMSKVLHPDAGGNTALMRELNDARRATDLAQ
jgi:hypothetical protein